MHYVILPPRYTVAGTEYTLPAVSDGVFADARFRVEEARETRGEGLLLLARTYTNVSGGPLSFQGALYVQTAFVPDHYVIPAVSYNGNPFGTDREPKGLSCDGAPWVFSYERTAIPACTVSENAAAFFSLFADVREASPLCACTLQRNADGTMTHGILFPNIERPLSYTAKNHYTAAYEPTLTLGAGERVTFRACLLSGAPRFPRFATAAVEDAAMRLFRPALPVPDREALRAATLAYLDTLSLAREDGGRLIAVGAGYDEAGNVVPYPNYEIGWCGQNAMIARLFLEEYARTGERRLFDNAVALLDTWTAAFCDNGLMYVYFGEIGQADRLADTCNLGYAGAELLRAYRLAREAGVERPLWREKALGIADFMLAHAPDGNFGRAWNVTTGEMVRDGGTVGAFLIPALLEAYAETGREDYLALARRAYAFYCGRDLDGFVCTAGALDSDCVDKETSFAMLTSALMLWEVTGERAYLDGAEKAAYYFCSFMFHYDVSYPADCEFTAYNWHTAGGTAVSVTHHHMDPWGVFCVESFLKLAAATGDPLWRTRADLMFANAAQCVALGDDFVVHGKRRPRGSQNEAYFHCRWCWYPDGDPKPGMFNDWLVGWPCAFRLHAIHAYDRAGV